MRYEAADVIAGHLRGSFQKPGNILFYTIMNDTVSSLGAQLRLLG